MMANDDGRGGHQPPKPLDPEVVYELYYGQALSLRAIARRLGCSHQHVANEMARQGWERREQAVATQLATPRRRDLDTPALPAAYRAGATTGQLAEAHGAGRTTIRRRLRGSGIELDPGRRRPARKRPDLDDKAMRHDYRSGLSLRQVARKHDTTPATVRRRLRAMGEPLRAAHVHTRPDTRAT